MMSIIGFLVILAPLVIFHEFGHYFFARLFGVKAEIFSLGFGKTLWKKEKWGTEWRVSLIPLGGYVKLLGEDPDRALSPEEANQALPRKTRWQRFWIFFGGPLFNFILAAFVFALIMIIGEPQIANVVGRVEKNSTAESAGIRAGDRILAVQDQPVKKFEEILEIVAKHPNKIVSMELLSKKTDTKKIVQVAVSSFSGMGEFGETSNIGNIDGLQPRGRGLTIGVSSPQSAGAKQGIETGDKLLAWNGKPLSSWEEISDLWLQDPGAGNIELDIERDGKTRKVLLSNLNRQPPATFEESAGLRSVELFVENAVPDSPAAKAGIKKGDRLVSINDNEILSFTGLRKLVQSSAEGTGKVQLRIERGGEYMDLEIIPTATKTKDHALNVQTNYTIGVVPFLSMAETEMILERTLNPFVLAYKATARMLDFSYRNLVSIGKLFTGDVSMGTLGGPILIGKIAGESLTRGIIAFLTTMAMISIGLGILNILPVPVLDGGHILLLGIEALRGKPLSMKQIEVIHQVGFSLILMLLVVVMKNDISRLSIFD